MFIQTETTPNPQTLKFLPGRAVLEAGTRFYTGEHMAEESPLAMALFRISGVNAVFFGSDFVTITKDSTFDWSLLKADILTTLMDFFLSDAPIIQQKTSAPKAANSGEEDSDIVKEIKELIEAKVRPAVAQDGGDIIFHSFIEGIVFLELHGSCSGCPSSTLTLKQGIENMLKHYIPEVQSVEAV
ncbi:MAG: NifU family protein [Alphaproteobacteria bacterium]|nr:MAG: NifU family protein [Alphaproteobacteria bacterium]TAF15644.1 MAG: NifU family protein [Alphaproteobacteria bacterium]TAF76193.1 MAG: NifU family protein [Alphaproteobacteria bacterium]